MPEIILAAAASFLLTIATFCFIGLVYALAVYISPWFAVLACLTVVCWFIVMIKVVVEG